MFIRKRFPVRNRDRTRCGRPPNTEHTQKQAMAHGVFGAVASVTVSSLKCRARAPASELNWVMTRLLLARSSPGCSENCWNSSEKRRVFYSSPPDASRRLCGLECMVVFQRYNSGDDPHILISVRAASGIFLHVHPQAFPGAKSRSHALWSSSQHTQTGCSVAGPKSYTGVFWKCYGPVTSFRSRFSMAITTPGRLVMHTMLIM
jgi:hypothetical protein